MRKEYVLVCVLVLVCFGLFRFCFFTPIHRHPFLTAFRIWDWWIFHLIQFVIISTSQIQKSLPVQTDQRLFPGFGTDFPCHTVKAGTSVTIRLFNLHSLQHILCVSFLLFAKHLTALVETIGKKCQIQVWSCCKCKSAFGIILNLYLFWKMNVKKFMCYKCVLLRKVMEGGKTC